MPNELSDDRKAIPLPADFPIGSPESRAAARAMVEQMTDPFHVDYCIIDTGFPQPVGLVAGDGGAVVTEPGFVTNYAMPDGSIVEVIVHRCDDSEGATGYIHQAWPDGRCYEWKQGECYVSSLDELKSMVDAGKAERVAFRGFPGREYVTRTSETD